MNKLFFIIVIIYKTSMVSYHHKNEERVEAPDELEEA